MSDLVYNRAATRLIGLSISGKAMKTRSLLPTATDCSMDSVTRTRVTRALLIRQGLDPLQTLTLHWTGNH